MKATSMGGCSYRFAQAVRKRAGLDDEKPQGRGSSCSADDLVAELRAIRPANPLPTARLFRVPKPETVKADLVAAVIPLVDAQGRKVDLHALRHTLATNLARGGVAPRTAMEAMRHSDMKLTAKTYTDAGLLPMADAMDKLPRYDQGATVDEEKATGTDGRDVSEMRFTKALHNLGSQAVTRCPSLSHFMQPAMWQKPRKLRQIVTPCRTWTRSVRQAKQARATGLEPATSGSTVRCSNQLSYAPGLLFRLSSAMLPPEPRNPRNS